jgi:hypothetical protein
MQQLVIWAGAVIGALWGLLRAINTNEKLSAARTL